MGAIGYHYNQRHLKPDASLHKSEFANYISQKIGKNDLVFDTDKNGYKNLMLWKFRSYEQISNGKVDVPT